MCINFVFHQLNNIISFDLSTLFDYFNLALSHSLFVASITLINRNYCKFLWFNIELVNPRQLLRKLQCKYASSKLESDLITYTVVDRFTRKSFSLQTRLTSLICSIVMEYMLSKLINYLSPF